MTQQYIVGELSSLLGDLQPVPGEWAGAVDALRREVETSPPGVLPGLAREAMKLTDIVCWAALERGDLGAFRAYADRAVALREFAQNAGLLP